MGSINDDLMSGGLLQAALISTDANGKVEGLNGPDGRRVSPSAFSMSKKLALAMRSLDYADYPLRFYVAGDSTGTNDNEWAYLLAEKLSQTYPGHTHDYRRWDDDNQQYFPTERFVTGTEGAAHCDTGIAATSWKYVITKSAAISMDGGEDMDVRARINLNGALPSAQFVVASDFVIAGNQKSWRLDVRTDGKLYFGNSADGSVTISRNSTASLSGADLTGPIYIRATLDGDNGAAGNTVTFYKSTDGITWTQLGDPVVTAGTTTVFGSTADFQFIGLTGSNLAQQTRDISFYSCTVYASLDESARLIDIDLGDVPFVSSATSITFVDRKGNTVTQTSSASTGSIGGSPCCLFSNGSYAGQNVGYHADETRFPKWVHGLPNIAIINHSHNDLTDIDYRPNYKALTDLLIARNPDVAIVALTQNHRISYSTTGREHGLRMRQIADLAGSQGFDLIDVYKYLDDDSLLEDTVHPNDAGRALQSSVINAYFGLLG